MRGLALFLIAMIFGGGIGFVLAAANGVTFDGHDHSNPAHHGAHTAAHDTPLEIPAENAPEVQIALHPDPKSGINLHIKTQNFTFAPLSASRDHIPGEGHAHLYINGTKQGRLYGPWHHIAALPPGGDVEIKVTLNANDHRALTLNGAEISATTTLSDN